MGLFPPKFMINEMTLILILFPFFDGDFRRRPPYGVYISQLIRVCCDIEDLNARSKCLTAKLLN